MDKKKLFDAIDKIDDSFIAESMQKGGAARNRSESHAGIWATVAIIAAAAILIVFTTYHIHHNKTIAPKEDVAATLEPTNTTVEGSEEKQTVPRSDQYNTMPTLYPPEDMEAVDDWGLLKPVSMVPGSVHLFSSWTSMNLAAMWNNYLLNPSISPLGCGLMEEGFYRVFVPTENIEVYRYPYQYKETRWLTTERYYYAIGSDTKEWIKLIDSDNNSYYLHYTIDYSDPDEPEEILLTENGSYRMRDLFLYDGLPTDNCERTIAYYDVSSIPEYADIPSGKTPFMSISEYTDVSAFVKDMDNAPVWNYYGEDEKERLIAELEAQPGPVRVYLQMTYGAFYNTNIYDSVNDRLIIIDHRVTYKADGTPSFTRVENQYGAPVLTLWIGRNTDLVDGASGAQKEGYSEYMYVVSNIIPDQTKSGINATLDDLNSTEMRELQRGLEYYPTHYMVPGSTDVFTDWIKTDSYLEDDVYYQRYDKALVLKQELNGYSSRSVTSGTIPLTVGAVYHAVASDSEHWILIEDEAGNRAWLHYGVELRAYGSRPLRLFIYSTNRLFTDYFTVE